MNAQKIAHRPRGQYDIRMKEASAKKETDTEMLARLMAEGFGEMRQDMQEQFGEVHAEFKKVHARLSDIDGDLIEVNDRLLHLEKGQLDLYRSVAVLSN